MGGGSLILLQPLLFCKVELSAPAQRIQLVAANESRSQGEAELNVLGIATVQLAV